MPKFISNLWTVMVNETDLSDHAFNIDAPQEKEQIDVSGFGRSREFLQGLEDATLTVQFLTDFGTPSVHSVLYPLYTSGSAFPVWVRSNSSSPGTTGAENPAFGGSAVLFSYNGGAAALGERAELTAEFKPAPNSQFEWGTTTPGTTS